MTDCTHSSSGDDDRGDSGGELVMPDISNMLELSFSEGRALKLRA